MTTLLEYYNTRFQILISKVTGSYIRMKRECLVCYERICGIKRCQKTIKYFVSLPMEEAHHNTHKTGGMHAMAQHIHPKIIAKIHELVEAGISELPEVKHALKLCHYLTSISKQR